MSFKGEIAFGTLNSKFKTGFNIGDVYRVQGSGNLVPNNYPVSNGEFVEWTANGWRHSGDRYALLNETEELFYADFPCESNTLRFKFSKLDYDPTVTGVGGAGTWKKLATKFLNIWDWTNENTNWGESFEGAFPDADNEVSIIAAGDTSDVTDIGRMFAGVFVNHPNQSSYSLTTRNNIISCVPFNVSGCTNLIYCFCGTCLKEVVKFHYSNQLTYSSDGTTGIFADSYVTEANIDFYSISAKLSTLFARCEQLKNVSLKGVENISNLASAFYKCRPELNEITIDGELTNTTNLQTFAQNSYNIKKIHVKAPKNGLILQAAFNGCQSLTDLSFQTGKPSRVDFIFTNCYKLKNLPSIDTSDCTHFENMMAGCENVETIPDYDVSSATTVQNMCLNMYKAKYGILEMYNKLLARGTAITNHTNCFNNCGRDTEEGRVALAQIPQSWGGLAEG